MIRRIVIFSLILCILTVAISLNLHLNENLVFLLPVVALIFGGLIVRELYIGTKKEFKEKNSILNFEDQNRENPVHFSTISKRPFLFGFENKLVSLYEFGYDEQYFYATDHIGNQQKFNLSAITNLSRSMLSINKRRIWQINIGQINEGKLTFRFCSNYNIFNKNFKDFHEKLKMINPAAVKDDWSIWKV